ncbi:MAG TPA: hypothetical protein VN682_19275 [Terriglobales bacterium]|nr:hypothetical protein [Terriglobales bacterium]
MAKAVDKKAVTKKSTVKTVKGRKGQSESGKRSYPIHTLKDALKVAQAIKDYNGGNPWTPMDVANALGVGGATNNFFYLTAASRDYGLTEGTRDTQQISIAPLGSEILYAANAELEHAKQIEAFRKIPIFDKVLDHYKGSSLPEMKYLGNTLERDFHLAPRFHEEFSKLFRDNCNDLGITGGSADSGTEKTSFEGERPLTVVLGGPKGAAKGTLKAFIIMPFTERRPDRPPGFFSEVLRSLLTPAGIAAGFVVETANRQGSDVIQSTIINELMEADLVIADLTDHNPNVLFELGVRMAEDKPVALIKASDTGRIFDIDNMLRVYEYSPNLWHSTIESDLPKIAEHIKAAWNSRDTSQTYMRLLRKGAKG